MNVPITPPVPATLRHDPISHFHWLELSQRASDEVIAELKAAGWRWSGYRQQWRTNRRYYAIPASLSVTDAGACDYASERADRLDAHADSHYGSFQAQHAKASAIASHIPLGQPILVGHHSERRHRRDLARIDRAERAAFGELEESRRLKGAAENSRRHQAYKTTAPALAKRLDRLQTEERQLERIIAGLTVRAEAGEDVAAYRQQCDWRMERVRSEIAEVTEQLAQSGGLLADQVEVHVGDIVRLRGHIVRVTRINRKTYSGVIHAPDNRNLDGWPIKADRSDLREIIERAGESLGESLGEPGERQDAPSREEK